MVGGKGVSLRLESYLMAPFNLLIFKSLILKQSKWQSGIRNMNFGGAQFIPEVDEVKS